MKIFNNMKNSDYVDERVKLQRLNIINQAYAIVMLILMVSILIKQFVYDMSFSTYITEFIAFFTASFYILIRSCFLGHRVYSGKKRLSLIITPLVTATFITLVSLLGNLEHHKRIQNFWLTASTIAITFMSSFILIFVTILIIDKISKRRNTKLQDEFENE